MQNRYNIVDRTWDFVVEYCERHALAFIPWYPLGAGMLDVPRPMQQVARRHDASTMQVALAWLLARSRVMLPIPGTSKVDHLVENIGAASLSLSADDLRTLDSMSAPESRL